LLDHKKPKKLVLHGTKQHKKKKQEMKRVYHHLYYLSCKVEHYSDKSEHKYTHLAEAKT